MSVSVDTAREQWRKCIENDGGYCPVCDRWGKIYERPINRTMARCLIWLSQQIMVDGWVDVPNTAPQWVVRSNQLSTLKWWGLVEQHPRGDAKLKHTGLWRITERGSLFANRALAIPLRAFTYNDEVVEYGTTLGFIDECCDSFFDYAGIIRDTYALRNSGLFSGGNHNG